MNPIEWAKSNPIPTTVIVVVGGVIFFVIVSGGGGGVSATSVSGPSDAQIAAEAQLSALRIQGSDAASARAAQVQLGEYNRDIELAQAEASLAAIEDTNATSVAIETIGYNTAVANFQSNQVLAQINSSTQLGIADFQYRGAVEEARISGQYNAEIARSQAEAARANTQAAVQIASIQSQSVDRQTDASVHVANISTAGIVNVAQIEADSMRNTMDNLRLINDRTQSEETYRTGLTTSAYVDVAEIESNNARRANRDNVIGNIFGSISNMISNIF